MNCMLLVKLFVGEEAIFIDDYETLLPFAKKFRFFVYSTIYVAVICYWLWSANDFLFFVLAQFYTRLEQFLLDDVGEYIVTCRKSVPLLSTCCWRKEQLWFFIA